MVDTPLVLPIYKCLYGITYRSVIWIISIWDIEHFIQITRFSQDIDLKTTNLIQTLFFYMVIQLTMHCSLIYTYHLILPFFKWFTRQSKIRGSWLNIFSNSSHEFRFHKTNVSHRHFYADVPIFTCVFRRWCIGLIKTYLGGPVP